jgi:hypothetical protein
MIPATGLRQSSSISLAGEFFDNPDVAPQQTNRSPGSHIPL